MGSRKFRPYAAIGYWASDFWKQQDRFSKGRARLMSWLRTVLLDFPQYRELLATALTDHLFSQKRVREGFTVWASDLELAPLFPELGEVKAT
jgi:elongation factor P--beta-lysine ligase